MSEIERQYFKRKDALHDARIVYRLYCEILGSENVRLSMDIENCRCSIITSDITGENYGIHYIWKEEGGSNGREKSKNVPKASRSHKASA